MIDWNKNLSFHCVILCFLMLLKFIIVIEFLHVIFWIRIRCNIQKNSIFFTLWSQILGIFHIYVLFKVTVRLLALCFWCLCSFVLFGTKSLCIWFFNWQIVRDRGLKSLICGSHTSNTWHVEHTYLNILTICRISSGRSLGRMNIMTLFRTRRRYRAVVYDVCDWADFVFWLLSAALDLRDKGFF